MIVNINNNTKQIKVMTTQVNEIGAANAAEPKNIGKKFIKKSKGIPEIAERYPEHIVQIALLMKNNAEIKRFTALGILNYLMQKGEISGENRYVAFKWNKFAVKCDGLAREYFYTEPFFLNCLIAAFTSFGASAKRTIDNFTRHELSKRVDDVAEESEIENINNLNESYIQQKQNKTADVVVEA